MDDYVTFSVQSIFPSRHSCSAVWWWISFAIHLHRDHRQLLLPLLAENSKSAVFQQGFFALSTLFFLLVSSDWELSLGYLLLILSCPDTSCRWTGSTYRPADVCHRHPFYSSFLDTHCIDAVQAFLVQRSYLIFVSYTMSCSPICFSGMVSPLIFII